jgi:hypothetical protein
LVKTVKTDLDKLTKKDINDVQDAINNWKKDNDKPVSDTTKMHFKLMLQHFLNKMEQAVETGNKNGNYMYIIL